MQVREGKGPGSRPPSEWYKILSLSYANLFFFSIESTSTESLNQDLLSSTSDSSLSELVSPSSSTEALANSFGDL